MSDPGSLSGVVVSVCSWALRLSMYLQLLHSGLSCVAVEAVNCFRSPVYEIQSLLDIV